MEKSDKDVAVWLYLTSSSWLVSIVRLGKVMSVKYGMQAQNSEIHTNTAGKGVKNWCRILNW